MVGCPYPFPAPLFIRLGQETIEMCETQSGLYMIMEGANSPQLSQLSEACNQFLFPTFAFVGEKYCRTRRGVR